MRALCVLVSGLCLAACCVGCTPSFPSNVELSGTWRGTQSSSVYPGFQPITLTLTQNGIDFSGRYTCESRDCLASSGTVSGYVDRDRFQATITFPDGRGTARVAGNVT